ncbi:PREDICTED: putative E3 ubiquitin-protein ligase LIN [Ipomoea nil]|uniref:putative E3 ubiquitin-protein ligase LIN n=1 Tax=Ipomoea nil TaxID=35883 RepID=UPI000901E107|nr:PREDICTED: putative E3 ubiquitin-protein ligase LIN [Ipomoea nil]XP_019192303.1 PREDICTED: putative E3 ubiquitin-protein ligase LIN [Ipomoea nil]
MDKKTSLFRQRKAQQQRHHPSGESSSSSPDSFMEEFGFLHSGRKHTPPKDFVCPITGHIFSDPVTLETGQTYERKAIQEWLDRGNSTCPITRQTLHTTQLPKTNYVLKRLVASWQENNPSSAVSNNSDDNDKPESVPNFQGIRRLDFRSNKTIDTSANDIHLALTCLCTSEILKESELAVLQIEKFWQEANSGAESLAMLSKPPVINGFVEILFTSVDPYVLKATVFLLAELGSRDKSVIQTLTRVDSDVECIIALFKKGLLEAVVVIYLLMPFPENCLDINVLDSLLAVLDSKDEDLIKMCVNPKTASVLLLGQILRTSREEKTSEIAKMVVSGKAVEAIVGSLEGESTEERISGVVILSRCMQVEGECRNVIADKAELAPVLESFMEANDGEKFEIVCFLSELVKLNRRTFNEQILHIIKNEGSYSSMHSLLVFLHNALPHQCPIISGLLLQLDLLVEPRKMSIYREEAIENLVSCLRSSDSPTAQIVAAKTIFSLRGRFSYSGEPLTRSFLLKRAGIEKTNKSLLQNDHHRNPSSDNPCKMEEERAAEEWERKMAFALVSHECGLLFEALAEDAKCADLFSACFVSATWLVYMLSILPDTGVRKVARISLLQQFVSIFQSSKDTEDKALSLLALSSFTRDRGELEESSSLAVEILKTVSGGQESSYELWNRKEIVQEDCSANGEVLSIVCSGSKVLSGHSDGTIKAWSLKGGVLHLVQETREHVKAVTSLAILQSAEKFYSGSLDRTLRVWAISNEGIRCEQVHEIKDHVNNLVVSESLSCFIPQGAGIKVHSWCGEFKLVNQAKHARCLALAKSKLYCGCQDNSIQEIDMNTGTVFSIQSGSRKLLGKASPVNALQLHDGLLYSAGSSLDGASVKIWDTWNHSMIASLPSTMEVRAMAVSSKSVFLGGKGGVVEVWCKKKYSRAGALQTGSGTAKVLGLSLDRNEEVLVVGTSDGKIQVWGLS